MKTSSKKGFTLIELIIVIAILGIIALIAVPNLSGIRQRSQVSADKRTAEQIGKAIRIWATDIDADRTRAIPIYSTTDTKAYRYDDEDTTKFVGLCPAYISSGYTAKSHKSGEGAFFVTSIDGGENNANQKIRVFIATSGSDELNLSTITLDGMEANYDGTDGDNLTGSPTASDKAAHMLAYAEK